MALTLGSTGQAVVFLGSTRALRQPAIAATLIHASPVRSKASLAALATLAVAVQLTERAGTRRRNSNSNNNKNNCRFVGLHNNNSNNSNNNKNNNNNNSRRLRLRARMRDSDEAWEAADYEDEKEAQFAVLRLLEETQRLEELAGGSGESRVMRAIQLEASGTDVASNVEGILTCKASTWKASNVEGTSERRPLPPRTLVLGSPSSAAQLLLARLKEEGSEESQFLDLTLLREPSSASFWEDTQVWEALVLCPDLGGRDDRSSQEIELNRCSLNAVLEARGKGSMPQLRRLFLLSRMEAPPDALAGFLGALGFGATSTWADLEAEFVTWAANIAGPGSSAKAVVIRTGLGAKLMVLT
ncbi:unnamed protein product, partial [Polarella glacialis]